MKALVVGGTGPSGPHVVNGLIKRGYDVTVLHGGQHEADFVRPVEHLHVDPHFAETLAPALQGRSFDLAIVTYGRTRVVAELLKGKTPRLIAISGSAVYAAPDDPRWGALGRPSLISEDSPLADRPEPSRFAHLIWLTEETIMRAQREGHYRTTIFRYPGQYGPNALANSDWSVVRRILDGRRHMIIPANAMMRKRGYP
jgi:nucleoside-diphosphate-sugar epimerase